MNLLCPECLGTLERRDSQVARCTAHGGEYQILFWRPASPPPVPPAPAATPAAAPASVPAAPPILKTVCAHHDNLPAVFSCQRCQTPLCDQCAVPQDDGSHLCQTCASLPGAEPALRGEGSAVALALANRKCRQHRHVPAVQVCQNCGDAMCATCDFLLPGNLHLCPICATAAPGGMSSKRKKMLFGSYALGVWCTVMFAGILGGAFREAARQSQTAVGIVFIILLLLPATFGLGLGAGAKGRHAGSVGVWVAILWNLLIIGAFIMLAVIGSLSRR